MAETTPQLVEPRGDPRRLTGSCAEADIIRLSPSTLSRILNQCDLKPHRHKMWLHSPDPDFKPKVTELCQLYLDPPEDSSVICVDEKTSMQLSLALRLGFLHEDERRPVADLAAQTAKTLNGLIRALRKACPGA